MLNPALTQVYISIHALCEEGDASDAGPPSVSMNFYPRPLRGGRLRPNEYNLCMLIFLSTPSARRATASHRGRRLRWTHFYPRPLRGGRQKLLHRAVKAIEFLSTPSARRATSCRCSRLVNERFLSTPSARRATRRGLHCLRESRISIHALCEEGDPILPRENDLAKISIHALCEEGDRTRPTRASSGWNFYPRPLRGGRRSTLRRMRDRRKISIHALCEEGDRLPLRREAWQADFYPRPLRGGRQEPVEVPDISKIFLSTPSARRATGEIPRYAGHHRISIHALCEEGDGSRYFRQLQSGYFYPRPLRGGRRLV